MFCFSTSTKSTITAVETSEFRKATSNGFAQELKSTSAELLLASKEQPTVKKELTLVSSKEVKPSRLEPVKEPSMELPKEEARGYQVLQKTSSTITLQSVKVPTGPKSERKTTCSRLEDDEKKAKPSMPTGWQSACSTRPSGFRTKELEDHVGLRKKLTDVKREPQGIPPQFESRPQSQEALEGEDVTFRCKGKWMQSEKTITWVSCTLGVRNTVVESNGLCNFRLQMLKTLKKQFPYVNNSLEVEH